MKYLTRALKYFLYMLVVLTLILAALVAFGLVEADVNVMFVHGYDSIWQIVLMLAGISLLYPRFGFTSRSVQLPGSDQEVVPVAIARMQDLGYVLEKNEDGVLTFRRKDVVSRVFKMLEDRITMERNAFGFDVEGLTRDVVRIVNVISSREEIQ